MIRSEMEPRVRDVHNVLYNLITHYHHRFENIYKIPSVTVSQSVNDVCFTNKWTRYYYCLNLLEPESKQ